MLGDGEVGRMFLIKSRADKAFTIVELLIVIVVIGVLAAITIVAFNGIQNRAKNTSIENMVSQYRRALATYVAENGDYPTGTTSACLGTQSFYTANGNCLNVSGAITSTFETEIRKVLANPPNPEPICYSMYSGCRRNMTYHYNNSWQVDGSPHGYYLIYFLGGNGACTLKDNLEGSYGNFSSTTSRGYMERHSGTTMCIVQLPNPA